MKAYELHPHEGLDALTLVDRPDVELGLYDVRVRVRAVSLNHRDLLVCKTAKRRKAPVIPASDSAGEVIEVGDQVTKVAIGDRVAAAFVPTWVDGPLTPGHQMLALGGPIDGVLAEHVVLPETGLVALPQRLSYEEGSTLPCAGVTAWNALFEAANLRLGDTVLTQGTGGVSIFALQLAIAAGATVIATSSSADKRDRLEKMGAAHTIDYREVPDWGDAVTAATGGRGADVAVEVGGADTFDQTVKALRYGGTMSLLGVLAGTRGQVDTHVVLQKNTRIHGVFVGSVRMFEDLVRSLDSSTIEPVINSVFPFDEARAAYEYLGTGAHFGKVVISVP